MHERQVAWLDGKPENVLCTGHCHSSSLRITICDFGVSHHFDNGKTSCFAKQRHDFLCVAPVMLQTAQAIKAV